MLAEALSDLAAVYLRTFATGWGEALAALTENRWSLATAAALLVVCAAAFIVGMRDARATMPAPRQIVRAFAAGLFLVAAAVVAMILINYTVHRMFFYVPLGGSVAVFSLLLLASRLVAERWRQPALTAACMALFLLCFPRIIEQQARMSLQSESQVGVLRQIVQLAPRPQPGANVVIFFQEEIPAILREQTQRLSGAPASLRAIYHEIDAVSVFVCEENSICPIRYGGEYPFPAATEADIAQLERTIFLEVRRDLSVELVEDPALRYGWDFPIDYDVHRLYDADAPLPPRAHTMLGLPRI